MQKRPNARTHEGPSVSSVSTGRACASDCVRLVKGEWIAIKRAPLLARSGLDLRIPDGHAAGRDRQLWRATAGCDSR